MGGGREDVSAQRLPSVWACAAYVLVFFLFFFCFAAAGKSVTSQVTRFLINFCVHCRHDSTGMVALLTIH